jgi:hypothetical protein
MIGGLINHKTTPFDVEIGRHVIETIDFRLALFASLYRQKVLREKNLFPNTCHEPAGRATRTFTAAAGA